MVGPLAAPAESQQLKAGLYSLGVACFWGMLTKIFSKTVWMTKIFSKTFWTPHGSWSYYLGTCNRAPYSRGSLGFGPKELMMIQLREPATFQATGTLSAAPAEEPLAISTTWHRLTSLMVSC